MCDFQVASVRHPLHFSARTGQPTWQGGATCNFFLEFGNIFRFTVTVWFLTVCTVPACGSWICQGAYQAVPVGMAGAEV